MTEELNEIEREDAPLSGEELSQGMAQKITGNEMIDEIINSLDDDDRESFIDALNEYVEERTESAELEALNQFTDNHFFIKCDQSAKELIEELIQQRIESEQHPEATVNQCLITMIKALQ